MKLFSLISVASAQWRTTAQTGYYGTSPRSTYVETYPTGTTPYETTESTDWRTTTGEPFRECGGTITGYETIASPFEYGSSLHPSNVQCVWNIELGDHVAGFNIVKNFFDVESHSVCGWDWVRITANGVEENFCGETDGVRSDGDKNEGGKWTPDQVNPRPDGFPESKFIAGGSAVIRMHSDNTYERRGFEFELVKLTRWEIINFHAQRVIDSVSDESWGGRYESRMQKALEKIAGAISEDESSCYDENFPQDGEEGDEITVFDADNMCKLNGQVNAAINSYARHNACEGRGKVYRQIIRSARKVKTFFNDKNDC